MSTEIVPLQEYMYSINSTPGPSGSMVNTSYEDRYMLPPYHHTLFIFLEVLSSILGIVSIAINSLSLGAMYFLKDKRSAYLRFLRNLNVTDLLASLTFLVIQNVQMTNTSTIFLLVSYIFRSLPWMFLTAYLLTLLSLAINQYLAVCKPWLYSRLVTGASVTCAITVTWILSTLQVMVPVGIVFALSLAKYDNTSQIVRRVSIQEMQIWMVFFTLIILLNVVLYVLVYQQISALKKRHAHRQDSANIRAKQKAFVTMTYLLLTGIFFWFPFPLMGLLGVSISVRENPYSWKALNAVISVLLYVNCLIDPLIYIIRVSEIRNAYHKMLKVCRSKTVECIRGPHMTSSDEQTTPQPEELHMMETL